MSAAILGQLIAGAVALIVGFTSAYFAFRTKDVELNAPDKISAAFIDLTSGLREEIERLEKRQRATDIRIEKLETRAREDEATIARLQSMIRWLLSRLRQEDKDEFDRVFQVSDV